MKYIHTHIAVCVNPNWMTYGVENSVCVCNACIWFRLCAVVSGIDLLYAEWYDETELSNALITPVRRKITTSYAKTETLPLPPSPTPTLKGSQLALKNIMSHVQTQQQRPEWTMVTLNWHLNK